MNEQKTASVLYKKLLRLYPRGFRERLGESMEQTFNDLYNEEQPQPARRFLVLSIFTETAIGIIREHLLLLRERDVMKNILDNPRSAAIASLLLSLPLGLTYVVLMFDIESLANLLNDWFTLPSRQGEINMLGRIVVFGGLLVLPVAFALNFQPILKKVGAAQKRRLHALNLIVGTLILFAHRFHMEWFDNGRNLLSKRIRCD